MRTVYLIGNGFDVNLDLPTRYNDFYNYYLGLNKSKDSVSVSKLKRHLEQCLNSKDNFWSDLEEAMGKYTTELSSYEQLEEVYDNLNDEIRNYIDAVEKAELPDNINVELLKKNISAPHSFLTLAEQGIINNLYHNIGFDTHSISIVNFNYTTTIEKILGFQNNPINLGAATYHKGYSTKLEKIYHIHGDSNQPILGINDTGQILNEKLRSDIDVQEYLIKPKINSALGHLIDRKSRQTIHDSNLICIYGLSLGNTDGIWWKLIGERLLSGITVILFVYDKNGVNLAPRKLARYKRNWKLKFCDAAKIQNSQRESIMDRLIIAPNTSIFNIKSKDV